MSGLIASQRTRSGIPDNSTYYVLKGQPIESPTLVAPVSISSQNTTAVINVQGNEASAFNGAINFTTGANVFQDAPARLGLTLVSGIDGVQAFVGANAPSGVDNVLSVNGSEGLGRVYDEIYNPVNKIGPVAELQGSIPATTGSGLFIFTPDRTGTYMLEVNFNIADTDTVANDGVIEYTLTQAGSEVQFCSNTLRSTQLSKAVQFNEINGEPGTLASPMDYSCSHLAILNSGVPTSFNLSVARASAAGGLPFSIASYQARVIQMC